MTDNEMHAIIPTGSSVLITGGRGLIGRYLTSALLNEGYKVSHLSRKANQFGKVRVFRWDPEKGILDPIIFSGVDTIVHLAGANIGEKRWTERRKTEITNSRVDSAKLIHEVLIKNKIPIKAFITASGVGYYGSVTSEKIYDEEDSAEGDFLGSTCRLWEEAAQLFENSGIRTVKIRNAVVLEKTDSALSKMMMPAKFGFLVQTGTGKQYMPWIHIADICYIYLKAIKDPAMKGVYNAVAPQHTTHKKFINTLAAVMGKPVFPIPVPAFLLRAILGKMSDVVLKGSRVSSERIENSGYIFLYPDLFGALKDVLNIHSRDSLA